MVTAHGYSVPGILGRLLQLFRVFLPDSEGHGIALAILYPVSRHFLYRGDHLASAEPGMGQTYAATSESRANGADEFPFTFGCVRSLVCGLWLRAERQDRR